MPALPVAVPLATHGHGRPALYHGNFNPSTNDAGQGGDLLHAANGSLFIQYGDIDEDCVETCVVALWQKTCLSDCDSVNWIPIATGGAAGPTTNVLTYNTETHLLTSTVNGVSSAVNLVTLMDLTTNLLTYNSETGALTSTVNTIASTVNIFSLLEHIYPNATIRIPTKIGMLLTFAADTNVIVDVNGPLTYEWTGDFTYDAPTGATTNATAPGPGEYQVILTITDADGQTFQAFDMVKVDYIIEIGGASREISDYFANLTLAIAWRDANDAGQTYKFIVMADTAEPEMLANVDHAHIVWTNGTTTTFAADERGFAWTSVTPEDVSLSTESPRPWDDPNIVVTGREAISLNDVIATNMRFLGLSMTGIFGIDVNNCLNVHLKDCSFICNAAGNGNTYNAHFYHNVDLTIERCTSYGRGHSYVLEDNHGRMIDCYGEVIAEPSLETSGALLIYNQALAIGGRFDVLGGRFVHNLDGFASVSGMPRCPITLSDHIVPTVASYNGLTVSGVSAVHRVVGGYAVGATSLVAGTTGVRFVGCSLVGALLNVTSIAGSASGQNHVIPS